MDTNENGVGTGSTPAPPKVVWEPYKLFRAYTLQVALGSIGTIRAIEVSIGEMQEDDLVAEATVLPLRIPRYSYRVGIWANGRLSQNLKPAASYDKALQRAAMLAKLVEKVEGVIQTQVALAEAVEAPRASRPGASTRSPGKTARDRAKHKEPSNRTNNPELSQKARGTGGGKK